MGLILFERISIKCKGSEKIGRLLEREINDSHDL